MAATSSAASRVVTKGGSVLLLAGLYIFLYAPIVYVIYISFNKDLIWPFPPQWTLDAYELLWTSTSYKEALWNSVLLGFGSAILCTVFATMGSISILKYRSRWRGLTALTADHSSPHLAIIDPPTASPTSNRCLAPHEAEPRGALASISAAGRPTRPRCTLRSVFPMTGGDLAP